MIDRNQTSLKAPKNAHAADMIRAIHAAQAEARAFYATPEGAALGRLEAALSRLSYVESRTYATTKMIREADEAVMRARDALVHLIKQLQREVGR